MSSDTQPGSEITLIAKKVQEGDITSLSEVLKGIAPIPEALPAPASIPLPAVITEAQEKALARLHEVFGKVTPTERRALEPVEALALMEERETLDELEKLAKARKEDIRTVVFNHLDVLVEREADARPEFDDKGHYVAEGEIPVPEKGQKFTRELRGASFSLSDADLQELEQGGVITHQQYLEMTDQVRVVNENKVMLAIQKDPSILGAIRQAVKPGRKTAALYVRKA